MNKIKRFVVLIIVACMLPVSSFALKLGDTVTCKIGENIPEDAVFTIVDNERNESEIGGSSSTDTNSQEEDTEFIYPNLVITDDGIIINGKKYPLSIICSRSDMEDVYGELFGLAEDDPLIKVMKETLGIDGNALLDILLDPDSLLINPTVFGEDYQDKINRIKETIQGLGLSEKEQTLWDKFLDNVLSDKNLEDFYGEVTKSILDWLDGIDITITLPIDNLIDQWSADVNADQDRCDENLDVMEILSIGSIQPGTQVIPLGSAYEFVSDQPGVTYEVGTQSFHLEIASDDHFDKVEEADEMEDILSSASLGSMIIDGAVVPSGNPWVYGSYKYNNTNSYIERVYKGKIEFNAEDFVAAIEQDQYYINCDLFSQTSESNANWVYHIKSDKNPSGSTLAMREKLHTWPIDLSETDPIKGMTYREELIETFSNMTTDDIVAIVDGVGSGVPHGQSYYESEAYQACLNAENVFCWACSPVRTSTGQFTGDKVFTVDIEIPLLPENSDAIITIENAEAQYKAGKMRLEEYLSIIESTSYYTLSSDGVTKGELVTPCTGVTSEFEEACKIRYPDGGWSYDPHFHPTSVKGETTVTRNDTQGYVMQGVDLEGGQFDGSGYMAISISSLYELSQYETKGDQYGYGLHDRVGESYPASADTLIYTITHTEIDQDSRFTPYELQYGTGSRVVDVDKWESWDAFWGNAGYMLGVNDKPVRVEYYTTEPNAVSYADNKTWDMFIAMRDDEESRPDAIISTDGKIISPVIEDRSGQDRTQEIISSLQCGEDFSSAGMEGVTWDRLYASEDASLPRTAKGNTPPNKYDYPVMETIIRNNVNGTSYTIGCTELDPWGQSDWGIRGGTAVANAEEGYITLWHLDENGYKSGSYVVISEDQALEMARYWFKKAGLPEDLIEGIVVCGDSTQTTAFAQPFHIIINQAKLLDYYVPQAEDPHKYQQKYNTTMGDLVRKFLKDGVDIFDTWQKLREKIKNGTATPEEESLCEQLEAEARSCADWYVRHSDEITEEDYAIIEGVIRIGTEIDPDLGDEVEKTRSDKEEITQGDEEEVVGEETDEDEEGEDDNKIYTDLREYLKSLGIDETEIPDEITIEWLQEIAKKIGVEELRKFFSNHVFNVDHYVTISVEDIRTEDTESRVLKNGTFDWTVVNQFQNGRSSTIHSVGGKEKTVTLQAKTTTVTAEGTVQRSKVVKVYYTLEETLVVEPFGWVISTKSVTGEGLGEAGVVSKKMEFSESKETVFSATFVIDDDDETIVVVYGLESYLVDLYEYINSIRGLSGYWVNAIKMNDSYEWAVEITQGRDSITTYRIK